MRLYIVRHGETEENKQRILQGHLPGTLTEEGKEQVRLTAQQLDRLGVSFKCIVSSDLKRATDSAGLIAERLRLPIVQTALLRERDWGVFTGISIAEAADKYQVDGKWVFPDESVETEEAIWRRAEGALRALAEEYPNDSIVVVTHGLFARNLIAAHLKCSYKEVPPLENAEVRLLEGVS